MNRNDRKLVLYTYSSDWRIEDNGGIGNGANPNMGHEFQVKESHNMIDFMPGDTFSIEKDEYPNELLNKVGRDCDIVLVNPKGVKL